MTGENDNKKSFPFLDLPIDDTSRALSEEDETRLREADKKNLDQAEEEQPSFIDSVEEYGLPPNGEAPSYLNPNDDVEDIDPHTKAYQDKIALALEEASTPVDNHENSDHDDITPV